MKLQSIDMKRTKDIAKIATPHGVAYMVSPDERVAASKVLRGKIPRKHGEWRPNPIFFCTSQPLVE